MGGGGKGKGKGKGKDDGGVFTCYYCGKPGHMSRDCPEQPDNILRKKAKADAGEESSDEKDDLHKAGKVDTLV